MFVRAMEALFTCLRNEAKSIPGCNTPSAKAGIERIISITRQHMGMTFYLQKSTPIDVIEQVYIVEMQMMFQSVFRKRETRKKKCRL